MRALQFSGGPRIGLASANASVFYARHWLTQIGLAPAAAAELEEPAVIIRAGEMEDDASAGAETEGAAVIVLWDFQVGRNGNGLLAAAAAGVSWVLGHADGPPLAFPIDVPEKWCGLVGANIAVSVLLEANLHDRPTPRRVDVSAADTLRSFADQNAGTETDMDRDWRRNGAVALGHGGIFPQGYYACRDGHVGLIGRSRKDWSAIRDVIGRPPWSSEERFDDPFALAANSKEVDGLLSTALRGFDRDELLSRAIAHGAPLAPVYEADELRDRGVVRQGFLSDSGGANLPFEIVAHAG